MGNGKDKVTNVTNVTNCMGRFPTYENTKDLYMKPVVLNRCGMIVQTVITKQKTRIIMRHLSTGV